MNLNTIHFTHKHPNVLYKNKNKITLHSIDFLKLRLFLNQLQHQLNTLNSSQQLLYRFRFIFKSSHISQNMLPKLFIFMITFLHESHKHKINCNRLMFLKLRPFLINDNIISVRKIPHSSCCIDSVYFQIFSHFKESVPKLFFSMVTFLHESHNYNWGLFSIIQF